MAKGNGGWDGELTRARLVESAERLFAERGVGSVSIREINRDARLAPSAVHYHFGSKEALLAAVVGRLDSAIGEVTLVQARQLAEREQPPTTRELVDLIAAPQIAALNADPVRTSRWLKIVSTLSWREASKSWPEVQGLIMTLLARSYPDLSESERLLRSGIAFATLTEVLAQAPTATSAAGQAQRERHIRACLDFVAAGLAGAMALASESSERKHDVPS